MLVSDGTSRCPAHKNVPGRWADRARGSRHERGYGSAWDRTRKEILQRDHGLCQPCMRQGYVTPAAIVDHIVPKAQGGSDEHQNLQTICRDCHTEKTTRESQAGRTGRGAAADGGGC